MLNILDFVPMSKYICAVKMREVGREERERKTDFKAEQCCLAYLVSYNQNPEEAGRMETLTPPSFPAGLWGCQATQFQEK